MNLHIIKIKDAINKAYLKLPPTRSQIETFKENFNYLFKHVKDSEGEEFHKNEISEFLKKTYYSPNHYINTRGRYDLVIHNGKDSTSSVGVIIEAKSPGNISEMPTVDNLNAKSILELILYYFRERITNKNLDLKHLITTNLYEWFIFDAHEFEKHFANNKFLVQKYIDFEEGRSSGKDTSFFYNSVAAVFLNTLDSEIKFTYLNLRDFEHIVINSNQEDDNLLIPLYKIFSPEHLLKLKFKNDSNSLDKDFYRELLHIIGLEETKQGSKKLIGRAGEKTRNYGSLLESAISILKAEDLISQVPRPTDFGETRDEQLFNISLELVITWINRILFLKLLESQLVKYNQGDKDFTFLNQTVIPGYDSLNKLFFHVLAIPENERDERLKERFKNIPYLNSSLFESTDLERKTIRISNLDDENKLPIHKSTVLKDNMGKSISGEKTTLAYLFEFLDSYNFSSEGGKGIQEENKALINASVLGLIFEKINGYKDGSYFTPGFITQYMCHETITRALIQKFNETKAWICDSLIDVYNKIDNKQEANRIINNLRICDPAVGSGHFLVSALNEILSIKSELKILMDKKGRVLRDYQFEVINDELIISNQDGELFEYNPKNDESQRVQEAIFHEKQTIIESCLFGVDINPNSVKICRLRLWIELLKHAYYKTGIHHQELETLPNIDINIKCGNSLISRYSLDTNIKSALKESKWTVDSYREAVINYRNASSKEEKRTLENLISKIKNDFATEVSRTNQDVKSLNKHKNELLQLTSVQLFEYDDHQKKDWIKKLEILNSNIAKLELKISEIKDNTVYKNAFEWRFEFPEVLDNNGIFLGFDLLIGNPPYIPLEAFNYRVKEYYKQKFPFFERKYETSVLFIVLACNLLKFKGLLSMIAPGTWQTGENYSKFRDFLVNQKGINVIINLPFNIFEDAFIDTSIYIIDNQPHEGYKILNFNKKDVIKELNNLHFTQVNKSKIKPPDYKLILDNNAFDLYTNFQKENYIPLGKITKSTQGLAGSNFLTAEDTSGSNYLFPYLTKGNVYNYVLIKETVIKTDLSNRKSLMQFYEAEPKILIRRIINRKNRLSVGYTEERLVFKKDINPFICIDKRYSTKFLVGLLSSKFMSFLYVKLSSIALKDDFRQTTLAELRKLPIPIISEIQQKPIIDLTDQIRFYKIRDLSYDTRSQEKEIDRLVYNIYGLSEEEILIIENFYDYLD